MEDHLGKVREAAEEDVRILQEAVSAMQRLAEIRGPVTQSPVATITVNAGGLAVWVLALACSVVVAVALTAVVFVAIGMSDLNRQTQELRQTDQTIQAYINSGLVQPKEESEQ